MRRLAGFITRHPKTITLVFLVLLVISGWAFLQVGVEYDLSTYLPEAVPSTQALRVMQEEFGSELANLQIMIPVEDVAAALAFKEQLLERPEVLEVLWLDDQVDIGTPLALLDADLVSGFYRDDNALFTATISREANANEVLAQLQELVGEAGALSGQIVELGKAQDAVKSEIAKIIMIAIPLALLILVLATDSWLEPILFLFTIMAGVILNFGSNLLFGEISFITQSVAGVLQLAVTMDYTIYLLHRFAEYRAEGLDSKAAMIEAMQKSFPAIVASGLTTLFGFLALVFMRFGIGRDMGLVLAKGVVFSLITVMLLLPALVLLLERALARTRHRSFWPSFRFVGRLSLKIGVPVLIVALVVAVPVFKASRANDFLYGMGAYPPGSREERDRQMILDVFGDSQQMVILVPRGEIAEQNALVEDLEDMPQIKTVISFTNQVGTAIPEDFLPSAAKKLLMSEHLSRIIVVADVPSEGEETFALAEDIRDLIEARFDDRAYTAGAAFSLLDMRDTIQEDDLLVNMLALLAVAVVILFTFRSFLLPVLLVLTIEISIWINLSIPYLMHNPLNYIGYLVISTVQLGATVDYAILMTQNYLDKRLVLPLSGAVEQATHETARTVIAPALILAAAGFSLFFVSSIKIVSELGLVLGRGALISLILVLFFLPTALRATDRLQGVLSFGRKK